MMTSNNLTTNNLNNLSNRLNTFRNHHTKSSDIYSKSYDEIITDERRDTINLHQQYIANSTTNTGSKSKSKNSSNTGQSSRGVKRNYNQANNLNNNANNHQSINGSCNSTTLNGNNTNGNLTNKHLNGQLTNGNLSNNLSNNKIIGKTELNGSLNDLNQVQINGKANHLSNSNNKNANSTLINVSDIKKELIEPTKFISIKNLKDEDLNLKELTETCKDESYDQHLLDDLSDGFNDDFVTKFLEEIGTMSSPSSNDTIITATNNYTTPNNQQQLCNVSPIQNNQNNANYYNMNVNNKNSSLTTNVHAMPNHQVTQQQQVNQTCQGTYTNGHQPINGQMKLTNVNKAQINKSTINNSNQQQILMVNVPTNNQIINQQQQPPPPPLPHQMQQPIMHHHQNQLNKPSTPVHIMNSNSQQQQNLNNNHTTMIHNNHQATTPHQQHLPVQPPITSSLPHQQTVTPISSINPNLNQPPINQMQSSNHHLQQQQQQQFNSNISYQSQNVQRVNPNNYQTQSQPNGMVVNNMPGQQFNQQSHHMQSHVQQQQANARIMQQQTPPPNLMQSNNQQQQLQQQPSQLSANSNQMQNTQQQTQFNSNLQYQQQGVHPAQYMHSSSSYSSQPVPPQQQTMNASQTNNNNNMQFNQQPPPQHSHMNHASLQQNSIQSNQRIMITNQTPSPHLINGQQMNGQPIGNGNQTMNSNLISRPNSQPHHHNQSLQSAAQYNPMNGPPPAKRSTTPLNNPMSNGMIVNQMPQQTNGPPPGQANQMYNYI